MLLWPGGVTVKELTLMLHTWEAAKIILQAVDAAFRGATESTIYPPDTDVFVLSLYPQLYSGIRFATRTGQRHRVINLRRVAQALRSMKVVALPGLHAASGADITGSFTGKGKATCMV